MSGSLPESALNTPGILLATAPYCGRARDGSAGAVGPGGMARREKGMEGWQLAGRAKGGRVEPGGPTRAPRAKAGCIGLFSKNPAVSPYPPVSEPAEVAVQHGVNFGKFR